MASREGRIESDGGIVCERCVVADSFRLRLRGALVHVAIALLAGWFLVPVAVTAVVDWASPAGPLVAMLLFVLPALTYLFLASLWAMRMLQELLQGARRL